MLFQELSKLKRNSIMTSVVLVAAGILFMIWPEKYVIALVNALGSIMVVSAMVMIMDFLGSEKSVMNFVYLSCALVLGIGGTAVLLFDVDVLNVLSWLFGIILIVDGFNSLLNAFIYARRSGRDGWWILIPLSLLLVICGIILVANPWWKSTWSILKAIGFMLLLSSVVSIVRLVWVWPIKSE
jgi:uncharacterized membrane protein HdeD (DUF308 family)